MDRQVRIDVPIKDLYKQSKVINFNPAYQRAYIAKDNVKWQQNLITNIIENQSIIPPIYSRVSSEILDMEIDNPNRINEEDTLKILGYTTEMIDGQQRTLTIRDFMEDKFRLGVCRPVYTQIKNNKVVTRKFKLDGCSFSEIKSQFPEVVERFENHSFSMICNCSADDDLIHKMFLDLNDLNNMTAQEKRNAINSEVAVYVRNTARLEPHKLFTMEDNLKGRYIRMTFKKMVQDELLAKIVSVVNGDAYVNGFNNKSLDNMYNLTSYKNEFKDDKKVKKVLDIMFKVIENETDHWKYHTSSILLNLAMVIKYVLDNKDLKVDNWEKFGEWFFDKHVELCIQTQANIAVGITETAYGQKTRMGSSATDVKFRRDTLIQELTKMLKDKEK